MELYRVILARAAHKDLRDTASYIKSWYSAPIAASKWARDIRKEINNKLSFMPQKYRLVNVLCLAAKGYRSIIVKNHKVFFVVCEKENVVRVRRIIYARRDLDRILSEGLQ